MAVLKLKPACKDYIWGGRRLIEEFHKTYDGDRLAETWELSCHPDGLSVITNGDWAGKSLKEYVAENGIQVLGRNCRRFQEFPILVKLIDAKDNLSIQVHPDNGFALQNEGQYGKTEMWYIVDCKEGSYLYYGFSREIDRQEFQQRIENDTLLEVLNKVPVQKGDVFLIEAGTIHAIGKDIVIAEIQQNSNVTYRVYDYGRRDKDGHQRDLHIEKALAVTNRIPILRNKNAIPHLANCEYFTVDKLNLDGCMMERMVGTITDDSFVSILVLDGQGVIRCGDDCVDFAKGDSLFLPAGSGEFSVEGPCEALVTSIGKKASPIRIAVYMSSKSIEIGLMDVNQSCIASTTLSINPKDGWQQTIARIGDTVRALLHEHDLRLDNCVGVGAALPGTIDPKHGQIIYSNNIGWADVPFVEELQKHLPLPIYIQNNANCIALGELVSGAAHGCANALLFTIGNGIGGSVILNGQLFEGGRLGGGELGHTTICFDGADCTCGRKGCLEAYASIPALIRQTREAMLNTDDSLMWALCDNTLDNVTEFTAFDAAAQGDPPAIQLIDLYIRRLCAGIINAVNVFRPEVILLRSALLDRREDLLDTIQQHLATECFGGDKNSIPTVRKIALGSMAGLVGAANLI